MGAMETVVEKDEPRAPISKNVLRAGFNFPSTAFKKMGRPKPPQGDR